MTADLQWQFDLVWALADLHLTALSEDDFLWEAADLAWTVRRDAKGVWRPEWSEDSGHTVAHTTPWVSVELTKLRLMRAANRKLG